MGRKLRPPGARVRIPLQRPSMRRRDYHDGNYIYMCSSDWTYLWTSFAESATSFADSATSVADSATSFADSATSFADSATMELATWVDRERVLLSAYRLYALSKELEPGQSNHIFKATRWIWQRAACWSKAPCWCDVDITRRHQTYKVFVPKRRYIPSNQGEYRPTRRQWQNRCSNHVRYQMDDKGRRPGW